MADLIPTVEDFKKLANDMGLVPMRHTKTTGTDFKDSVRGYTPEVALRMYQQELAEPDKGKVKPTGKPAPDDGDGDGDAKDTRKAAGNADPGAVEIPPEYATGSALMITRLAKAISGSSESITKDEGLKVIEAELKRREAAKGQGPNGTNTASVGAATAA